MNRTFALIPAAGKSSRMGRPKLTLPLDGRLVIERVIDALRQAGVEQILVVVAPHVPELMTIAQAAGAHVLMLAEETPDMRATVEAGLDWLEREYVPKPDDNWLLVPADHPVLDPKVVRKLLRTRAKHSDCSIVIPAYAGRRGHPALIDWKHVEGMRALPAGEGLNVYLRSHTEETYEVLADSPTVLLDLDTPEEYEHLRQSWEKLRPKWSKFWLIMATRIYFVSAGMILGYLFIPSSWGPWSLVGGFIGWVVGDLVWSTVSLSLYWLRRLRAKGVAEPRSGAKTEQRSLRQPPGE